MKKLVSPQFFVLSYHNQLGVPLQSMFMITLSYFSDTFWLCRSHSVKLDDCEN
jgi:hypothetical protein